MKEKKEGNGQKQIVTLSANAASSFFLQKRKGEGQYQVSYLSLLRTFQVNHPSLLTVTTYEQPITIAFTFIHKNMTSYENGSKHSENIASTEKNTNQCTLSGLKLLTRCPPHLILCMHISIAKQQENTYIYIHTYTHGCAINVFFWYEA